MAFMLLCVLCLKWLMIHVLINGKLNKVLKTQCFAPQLIGFEDNQVDWIRSAVGMVGQSHLI